MNAIDVLMYGQRTLRGAIDRLGPDDWTAPGALGTWTAKDIVGHLGAFEVRFVETLSGFAGVPSERRLSLADPETFNDDQAAIRADWSVETVVAELLEAHDRVMDLARRIPAERWSEVGTIPWYGLEYSLDDLVVYTMYGHKREHTAQLEAVLDRAR
ncbi:MAG TPA: DinB family protein [Candidatus Limnocylindrales bacterium]|nr:DinB family protein [Candidatus Limnocylindrales bacterium]